MPTFNTEPAYTEQDLREAAVFMGAVKLTEAVLKNDFRVSEIVEELATKIAEWRSEARAGMREACAGHLPDAKVIIGTGYYRLKCSCGWSSTGQTDDSQSEWEAHIHSLPDLAADEAIERIKREAHESGIREGASNEALLQRMFNEDGPVKIELERIKREARLDEHRRECVIWKFVTNNPCEAPQTCERCAALSGKETA